MWDRSTPRNSGFDRARNQDYNLRVDYTSKNEIGQLASAFNDMLSELAAARERERNAQAEYMRAARLTTMGAMTASIAHEINQPLAAIAAFGNAGRRWLSGPQPDIDEARTALTSIVKDAHRASQVIASVRAMFKKEGRPKVQVAVNDAIEDVLALVHGEIRKQRSGSSRAAAGSSRRGSGPDAVAAGAHEPLHERDRGDGRHHEPMNGCWRSRRGVRIKRL